jgi:hypothetical protein
MPVLLLFGQHTSKTLPLKEGAQRDVQFVKIADLKAGSTSRGNPIVSMDTKKKN